MDKRVRASALAGTWFEGSARDLDEQVGTLLQRAPRRVAGEVTALIEPHAGYRYSGRGAAAGYSVVAGREYRRVIVLAPSHYSGFTGFSIAPVTHFETPLGEVPLDLEALEPLRSHPLHRDVPGAHAPEHSIEIQVPFLQKSLPQAKLVPLLVGRLEGQHYAALAEDLRRLVEPDTLIVASSDFTHQGPRFDYQPFHEDLPDKIRELDFGAFEQIERLDPDGFLRYVERTGITVCGYRPIALLLHLLPAQTQVKMVSYYTSGDVLGDWDNSVSYLTTVFQKPDPHPPLQVEVLDREAQRVALRLAREAVTRHCRRQGPPDPPAVLPSALQAVGSCFVTLQKHGSLRGCIGRLQSPEPLWQGIVSNAVAAASEDPRFRPVTEAELPELDVEISVMTPLEPVSGPDAIELGRHGVVLQKYGRRAVFLPQVAVDQIWTVDELLDHLARKAGLPPGSWREPDTRFEVFSCQVFSESDPQLGEESRA